MQCLLDFEADPDKTAHNGHVAFDFVKPNIKDDQVLWPTEMRAAYLRGDFGEALIHWADQYAVDETNSSDSEGNQMGESSFGGFN